MRKPPANPTEQECPACNGTGNLLVVQPVRPGRKIYPPPCNKCGGRGRIKEAANSGGLARFLRLAYLV
jgi:DnaJ-class molecular chaperone